MFGLKAAFSISFCCSQLMAAAQLQIERIRSEAQLEIKNQE
jgi:hypothetical protein